MAVRELSSPIQGATMGVAIMINIAFNTPIAGVVFAVEELAKSFERRTNTVAILVVVVAGFTDTVGTPHGNDRLSLARAQAVTKLLLSRGLKPGSVVTVGRGERDPQVSTPPQVAEAAQVPEPVVQAHARPRHARQAAHVAERPISQPFR